MIYQIGLKEKKPAKKDKSSKPAPVVGVSPSKRSPAELPNAPQSKQIEGPRPTELAPPPPCLTPVDGRVGSPLPQSAVGLPCIGESRGRSSLRVTSHARSLLAQTLDAPPQSDQSPANSTSELKLELRPQSQPQPQSPSHAKSPSHPKSPSKPQSPSHAKSPSHRTPLAGGESPTKPTATPALKPFRSSSTSPVFMRSESHQSTATTPKPRPLARPAPIKTGTKIEDQPRTQKVVFNRGVGGGTTVRNLVGTAPLTTLKEEEPTSNEAEGSHQSSSQSRVAEVKKGKRFFECGLCFR